MTLLLAVCFDAACSARSRSLAKVVTDFYSSTIRIVGRVSAAGIGHQLL